jgi:hypothetical protein
MNTNFIKLTKRFGSGDLIVNPFMITCIESISGSPNGSCIYLMGGTSQSVTETPDIIEDMIEKASHFKFRYDDIKK